MAKNFGVYGVRAQYANHTLGHTHTPAPTPTPGSSDTIFIEDITSPVAGCIPLMTADGNLEASSFAPANFAASSHTHGASGTIEEITITTTGTTFAPTLVVTGDPTILWTFSTGATSTSATPSVNFGSSATRIHTLVVTPWSAVQRMNFGYDAGDGGSNDIERVSSCNVSALDGMHLVAPTLGQLCLSHCPIETLDLSDFVNLDTLECYQSDIRYITLWRTHRLSRICLEANALEFLDLSSCPSGADLRSAVQGGPLSGIIFGSCVKNWWHICCQTNSGMTIEMPQPREMIALEEWLTWYCQQHGDANGMIDFNTGRASVLRIVQASNNYYRHADFTNRFVEGNAGGYLDMANNLLETIVLTGCTNLTTCLLQNNLLTEAQVDGVLARLVAGAKTGGTVDLRDNAGPSIAGASNASTLRSRGWTVNTEETAVLVSIAVTPDITTVGEGNTRQFTATGTYDNLSTANITTSVDWSSSDETHATVGLHTGLATGVSASTSNEVTITATLGAIHDDTTLTVTGPAILMSIEVTPADSNVVEGATIQFTATGIYDDASEADITTDVVWLSDDETYVTIDQNGLATGVTELVSSSVVISATLNYVIGDTTLTVSAAAPAGAVAFTTEEAACRPSCVAAGGTVTWTLEGIGDVSGATPAEQSFGTAAHRTHSLAVSPMSALTQLRSHDTWTYTAITSWSGLSNFPNLNFFCEEGNTTLVSVDFTDCHSLNIVHLAGCTGMTAEAMDACFIALDNATTTGSSFYHIADRYTSASAAARASLAQKGWTLIPY